MFTYTEGNQQEEYNGSPHLQGWPCREASLPRSNSFLYHFQICCNIPIKEKKKRKKIKLSIYIKNVLLNTLLSAGIEKKNTQKAGRYHYTQHTGHNAEAGKEKTFPKFTERLFLWKGYFALLPSGPSREQLKSKAMCTKPLKAHRHMAAQT